MMDEFLLYKIARTLAETEGIDYTRKEFADEINHNGRFVSIAEEIMGLINDRLNEEFNAGYEMGMYSRVDEENLLMVIQ